MAEGQAYDYLYKGKWFSSGIQVVAILQAQSKKIIINIIFR